MGAIATSSGPLSRGLKKCSVRWSITARSDRPGPFLQVVRTTAVPPATAYSSAISASITEKHGQLDSTE
jgi:hypothetical protein